MGLELDEFEGPRYRRIHHIKELIASGRLDDRLRWQRIGAGLSSAVAHYAIHRRAGICLPADSTQPITRSPVAPLPGDEPWDAFRKLIMAIYKNETTCRISGSSNLETIIEFGETPLADRLLREDQLSDPELKAPLTLVFCPESSLAQIRETVDPEILFYAEYPYFSSVSQSLLRHFRESALYIMETRDLDENSLVMEAASNDGYMLKNFAEQGIPVLGIDPSKAPATAAQEAGIPTMITFFTTDLAQAIGRGG